MRGSVPFRALGVVRNCLKEPGGGRLETVSEIVGWLQFFMEDVISFVLCSHTNVANWAIEGEGDA